MVRFSKYLEHTTYRNFLPYNLDEEDKYILEIFNTKLNVKEVNSPFDFSTQWSIEGTVFNFNGKEISNNEWVVGFDKNYDVFYEKWDTDRYVGDVFTGVLESIKLLLQKEQVERLTFSTEKNNTWLIKFYTSNPFKRYIEKHFKFTLDGKIERNGLITWSYIKEG